MKKIITSLLLAIICAAPAICENECTIEEPIVKDFSYLYRISSTLVKEDGGCGIYVLTDDGYLLLDDNFNEIREISRSNLPSYHNGRRSEIRTMDDRVLEVVYDEVSYRPIVGTFEYYDYEVVADEPFFYLTQTLFNDDDLYEFIVYNGEETKTETTEILDNGTKIVEISYSFECKGIDIVNENGKILASLTPPFAIKEYSEYDVWRTKAGLFLLISDDRYTQTAIYKIDRENSGVKFVSTIKHALSVRPSAPRRSEYVTVELGEDAGYTTLQVVDASGRTAMSMNVAGKSAVQLDTAKLPSGLYVVRASDGQQAQETCKIIVR